VSADGGIESGSFNLPLPIANNFFCLLKLC
jgi:hypothetical protein